MPNSFKTQRADRWLARSSELWAVVEGPRATTLPEKQGSTFMWRWEDGYEQTKPPFGAWKINVRLGEGFLT